MTEKRANRLKKQLCHEFTTTIIKDSIVKVPIIYNDTALLELYLECDSLGNVLQVEKTTLNGKITTLQSELINNKVFVHSYTKVHDTVKITTTNTKVVAGTNIYTQKPLKTWQKVLIWAGVFEFLLLCLFVYLWIKSKTSIFKKLIP